MKRSGFGTFVLGLLWLILGMIVIFAAAQPVSLQAQVIICGGIAVAVIVLKFVRSEGMMRSVFLALSSFLVLRYLFWRISSTLPPIEDIWSFIPGVLLFTAELYAIFMFFVSIFVVIDPIHRPEVTLPEDQRFLPTVDVYVPSYNEDEDLLEVTLTAATQMRYPEGKLFVYLLDDGGTIQKRNDGNPDVALKARKRHESLQALCARLGVNYMTRERNDRAKAGNLNAAFPRTKGDLVCILDADHVPSGDFLERTVGYFMLDSKLFLVQTPHFFINPDPLERNLGTYRAMPSENEMFYGSIQRGLDKWNGTFFCGSAALLRRIALESTNGFSGESVTEDAETALDLHGKGWRSLYYDKPLIAGLQPESFVEFIQQRSRWSQGMLQILLLKNPLFKSGLTFGQRMSYLNSSLFWMFPFARLSFFLAPLFYLFFGLEIYHTTVAQFVAYTVPYMIASLIVQSYLFGVVRWPFISELYEYVQSMFTSRAMFRVLINPRSPTFRVTSKGETLDSDHLSPLYRPFLIMILLLLAGIAATVWRYYEHPLTRDILLVVGGWNIFNLFLAVAGFGVVCENQQRRRTPRVARKMRATLTVHGTVMDALVDDASIGGVSVRVPYSLVQMADWKNGPVSLQVLFPDEGRVATIGVKVRSVRADGATVVLGMRFDPQSLQERQDAVKLVYSDSRLWEEMQQARRTSPGVISGIIRFLVLTGIALRAMVRYMFTAKRGDTKEQAVGGAAPRSIPAMQPQGLAGLPPGLSTGSPSTAPRIGGVRQNNSGFGQGGSLTPPGPSQRN